MRCNLYDDWSGVDGKALTEGAFACLQALLEQGNRVIFDTVLIGQEEVEALRRRLDGVDVCAVALQCDWSEIEKGTLVRGDWTLAEAERSFVHALEFSDQGIVIDTTACSPGEIVAEVLPRVTRSH